MMKRITLITLITLLVSLLISLFSGVSFASDLNPNMPSVYFKDTIPEAISLGFVPKEIQGDYRKAITRGEFAKLFVNAIFTWQKNNLPAQDEEWLGTHAVSKEEVLANVQALDYNFTDVNDDDIKLAYILGLTNGTGNNKFSPEKPITRQEAATMLVNYFHNSLSPDYSSLQRIVKDINKCAAFARDSVMAAWDAQFFEGTSGNRNDPEPKVNMSPEGNFTREQAITIALRIYKSENLYFFNIRLRGKVYYVSHALKIDWSITKDTVTAIKFKSGTSLKYGEDLHFHDWKDYNTVGRNYPNATSEQKVAAYNDAIDLYWAHASDEMVIAACNNENAVFDLGYAEYEMLNKDYIYQYRFKNNGVYNNNTYGGAKMIPIPKTRIR